MKKIIKKYWKLFMKSWKKFFEKIFFRDFFGKSQNSENFYKKSKFRIFGFSPSDFWKKPKKEIIYFYKLAAEIDISKIKKQTLGHFLKSKKMSDYFINFHIMPMVAAIWSMPTELAKEMPMELFLNL